MIDVCEIINIRKFHFTASFLADLFSGCLRYLDTNKHSKNNRSTRQVTLQSIKYEPFLPFPRAKWVIIFCKENISVAVVKSVATEKRYSRENIVSGIVIKLYGDRRSSCGEHRITSRVVQSVCRIPDTDVILRISYTQSVHTEIVYSTNTLHLTCDSH